jgi:hypothetical protein
MSTDRPVPRTIELHIEELVLHGFDLADSSRITAAIEQELAHLLAEQGIASHLWQGADVFVPDGGTFEVAPGRAPEVAGARVARAVQGGLCR